MAEAARITLAREVKTIVEEPVVVLTLNLEEAALLATLLASVGGDPQISPRKTADDIAEVLSIEGFHWNSGRGRELYEQRSGSISFAANPFKAGDRVVVSKPHTFLGTRQYITLEEELQIGQTAEVESGPHGSNGGYLNVRGIHLPGAHPNAGKSFHSSIDARCLQHARP